MRERKRDNNSLCANVCKSVLVCLTLAVLMPPGGVKVCVLFLGFSGYMCVFVVVVVARVCVFVSWFPRDLSGRKKKKWWK